MGAHFLTASPRHPRGGKSQTGPEGRRALLLAWTALFAIMLGWALATPMGGAPDEPNHITKAVGTVRGQFVGSPTQDAAWEDFTVPRDVGAVIQPSPPCYMQKPDVPASCMHFFERADATPVSVRTQVGAYNPVYYAVVGWPSLFLHGSPAFYAMRVVSALLCSFFLAIVAFCATSRVQRRTPLLLGAVLGLTPMTFFLGAAVNPSGAEIASAAAVTALAWLLAVDRSSRHRLSVILLFGACAAFLANLRATSPLYLVLLLVPPLIVGGLPLLRELFARAFTWVIAATAAAAIIAGTVWAALVAMPAGYLPALPDHHGPVYAFARMIFFTYDYLAQAVGNLGYLDTPTPAPLVALWVIAFVALIAATLILSRGSSRLAILFSGAAWLLVPAVLEAPIAGKYGFIWQGRYMMPLLLSLLIASGFVSSNSASAHRGALQSFARRLVSASSTTRSLAVAMAIVSVVDFTIALRRNSVGTERSFVHLFSDPSWTPPGGILVSYLLLLAGLAGVVALCYRATRPTLQTAPASESDDEAARRAPAAS